MHARNRRSSARAGRALGVLLVALVCVAFGIAAGARWHEEVTQRLHLPWLTDRSSARSSDAADAQLYTCGMHPQVVRRGPGTCPICGMQLVPVRSSPSTGASTSEPPTAGSPRRERKVKYWWDPMTSPPYISDRPGKSPMGMDLLPVYEDEVAAGPTVVIDPAVVQNMGVRVAPVVEAPLVRRLRFFGVLKEPEPDHVDVNLRVGGWIEKLYADTEGMVLEKGDPLFDLYSPDLVVAVEELIAARKSLVALPETPPGSARSTTRTLFDSARRKLELWGLQEDQIDRLAALDDAPRTVVFRSPIKGHVTEKQVYEGAAVMPGQLVMRLASRERMWLDMKVQEPDLPWIKLGQRVVTKVDAVPDRDFAGEVVFFHPHLDMMTRTALARVLVPNGEFLLREGMYAIAEVEVEAFPRAIQVPREAIIDTGARQIAFVALESGHFEPRNVRMGLAARDGMVQVLQGLVPGESVVTSGQFLLDAESRLREAVQKFLQQKTEAAATAASAPEHAHAAAAAAEPGEGAGTGMPPAAGGAASTTPIVGEKEWRANVDAALGTYLALARSLGESGEEAVETDATQLADAAKRLAESAEGEDATRLAKQLGDAVRTLRDVPPLSRRDAFRRVSEVAVAIALRSPPSRSVATRLYVIHCPMAHTDWLQSVETVANPFFAAASMKRCGAVVRTLHASDR
jgi:Cu(I)/Ag(I) efflux system membrane fusion protein/cobalt-zinc-cadmium efflux system membrane fusion protein